MAIQIQAGKYYKRRDGVVRGPAKATTHPAYPWYVAGDLYEDNGKLFKSDVTDRSSHIKDLIEEVPEPA